MTTDIFSIDVSVFAVQYEVVSLWTYADDDFHTQESDVKISPHLQMRLGRRRTDCFSSKTSARP